MNADSSRSHTIYRVAIEVKGTHNDVQCTYIYVQYVQQDKRNCLIDRNKEDRNNEFVFRLCCQIIPFDLLLYVVVAIFVINVFVCLFVINPIDIFDDGGSSNAPGRGTFHLYLYVISILLYGSFITNLFNYLQLVSFCKYTYYHHIQ